MQNWKSYVLVLLLAMAPVVELRGAIPAGVAMGMELKTVFVLSVIGNLLPVPLIILFIRKVFAWMKRHGGKLAAIVSKMEAKAARGAQLFYKYELLGLYILVAIPLPGTGAWTGSLVAAMLNLRMRSAVPMIIAGVVTAGLIMFGVTYGVSGLASLF